MSNVTSSKRGVSKVEYAIVVLLIINIIISGLAIAYNASLSSSINSISEKQDELANSINAVSSNLGKIAGEMAKVTGTVINLTKPTAPTGPSITKLTITSGSTGGSMYLSTSAILSAIGSVDNIYLVHQAGAGVTGMILVTQGKTDIGVGSVIDAKDLWNKGFKDLRAVFPVAVFPGQLIVRADSDINSWSDVDGHPISIGARRFIANRMFRDVMEVLNIQPSKLIELGHRDSMEQLVTGVIDAYFFVGFPNPTVQEFCIRYNLKLVPPSEEELNVIKEKLPQYLIYTVDASGGKVYAGIDIAYDAPAVWSFHYSTPNVPQDVIYKLVKSYWEHRAKVAGKIFPQHKWFTPEVMFNSAPIPLHAGVVQYLQEINVTVPSELIPPEYSPPS